MFSTHAHTYFIIRRIFYTRLFTLHKKPHYSVSEETQLSKKTNLFRPFVISDKVLKMSPLQHFLHMPPDIIKRLFLLFYW